MQVQSRQRGPEYGGIYTESGKAGYVVRCLVKTFVLSGGGDSGGSDDEH